MDNPVAKQTGNIVWHNATVTKERREKLLGHKGVVVWFTGLSGSGKSTIAHTVEEKLHVSGCHTFVFDGDNVRHGLCEDLGFGRADRTENIRRIAEMCALFTKAGVISLTAFISPYERDRKMVREKVGPENFIEVYCKCSIEVCEARDVKGVYAKARAGAIAEFTGISSPYEAPMDCDLVLETDRQTLDESVEQVLKLLESRAVLGKKR